MRAGNLQARCTDGTFGSAADPAGSDIAVSGEAGRSISSGFDAAMLWQEMVDTVRLVHR